MRGFYTRKRPVLGVLFSAEVVYNKKLSTNRIIIKNLFGRLSEVWALLARKWRCSQLIFDRAFQPGVKFTKVYIQPLQAYKTDKFRQNLNQLVQIAQDVVNNCRRLSQRYRYRRRIRLNWQCRQTKFADC